MEASGEASELLATRRRKLEALREAGVDPFPHAYPGVTAIGEAAAPHEGLEPGDETDVRVRVAGRIASRRVQGKALTYTIVGSTEADPGANRLSNESPVGKALVGRKKGDAVKVTLPSGKQRELTVTKIEVA